MTIKQVSPRRYEITDEFGLAATVANKHGLWRLEFSNGLGEDGSYLSLDKALRDAGIALGVSADA